MYTHPLTVMVTLLTFLHPATAHIYGFGWEHGGYNGGLFPITNELIGWCDALPAASNNKISSVAIAAGWRCTFWNNEWCEEGGGPSWTVGGPQQVNQPLVPASMNDKITSYRCYRA
jgi:hypothetical protein